MGVGNGTRGTFQGMIAKECLGNVSDASKKKSEIPPHSKWVPISVRCSLQGLDRKSVQTIHPKTGPNEEEGAFR